MERVMGIDRQRIYELCPVALLVAEERSDERTVRGQEQPARASPLSGPIPINTTSHNKNPE